MYDLTRHGASPAAYAGAPAGAVQTSLLLTALRARQVLGRALHVSASWTPSCRPPTRDRVVRCSCSRVSTPPTRPPGAAVRHLRRLGYQPHGWGLGRNFGLTDDIIDGVLARFDEVDARHDEPVSVVGWSFGGLLARWVAHQRPDRVRQVVCLGSPYRPEGEHTRTTPLFERTARDPRPLDPRPRGRRDAPRPLPVPVTAIYSGPTAS